jgi:hypothetical protein
MAPSVASVAVAGSVWVLQTLGPSALVDVPAPVRAAVAFVLTVAFGGAVIYRYGGRIDGAVDASMTSPLLSVVYGIVAYGLVGAAVLYVYSQLVLLGVESVVLTVAAAAVLLSLGGLGFVVIGTWLADVLGVDSPWLGLVGVGLVGAAALFVLPPSAGLLVWFGIAAVGVGGPARRWIHADAVDAAEPG